MSKPRQVIPGSTIFLSRRVSQRMFLLKPRPIVEQAFLYVMAVAARKYNIQVHAAIVLSNHWHALMTDPEGNHPAFTSYVHEFTAQILNCSMRRFENFWSSEKPSVVVLENEDDILDKLTYLMANAVAAQLVKRGEKWPGLRRMWSAKDASATVDRPDCYYSKKGTMALQETLSFVRPPVFAHLDDEATCKKLQELVEERESNERKRIASFGGKYLGVKAILRQRLTATPRSVAKHFKMSPNIGAKNKWRRIESIRALKQFYVDYRNALVAWRNGQADVEFPYGTYALRHSASIRCAAC